MILKRYQRSSRRVSRVRRVEYIRHQVIQGKDQRNADSCTYQQVRTALIFTSLVFYLTFRFGGFHCAKVDKPTNPRHPGCPVY
jgi:hypothetical protein